MLQPEERSQLTSIIAGLNEFTDDGARGRRILIQQANLHRFLPMDLSGDQETVAGDLIGRLEKYNDLLPEQPTKHALGALLSYVLTRRDLPPENARFMAHLIVRYSLVTDPVYVDMLRTQYIESTPSHEVALREISGTVPPLELSMPRSGETFLNRPDREWVVRTVDTVIGPMSVEGIKNLLRDRLPNSSINRINFRDGSRNIAETIVGMLEQRGVLNPPDYHALGSLLAEMAEAELISYDASVKIVALLFRYNLVKGRTQITELSSRFHVPSPVLSAEKHDTQHLSLLHLPPRLRTPQLNEQLESLYHRGINYMLDVNFLLSGAKAVCSVCRVEFDKRGEGTGFLIAPEFILTNYHVMLPSAYLGDPDLRARKCGVRFGAIKERDGGVSAGQYFKLHDAWRVAESEPNKLDYMLIRLHRPVTAEDRIFPLPLEMPSIQKEMFVNIIQHPNNGSMEVSLRFNQVIAIEGNRVYYLADTQKGSSGSPVFDDEWRVVALHRSGGEFDASGQLIAEANAGVPMEFIQKEIAPYLNN